MPFFVSHKDGKQDNFQSAREKSLARSYQAGRCRPLNVALKLSERDFNCQQREMHRCAEPLTDA